MAERYGDVDMNPFVWFDWINVIDRVAGIAAVIRYGEIGKQVRIKHPKPGKNGKPPKGARTGNDCARMLKEYSVPVFWRRTTPERNIFNVPAKQWQWAVDLLTIFGAEVEHKADPWALNRHGAMPTPWKQQGHGQKQKQSASKESWNDWR